jgi:hypothetical protein
MTFEFKQDRPLLRDCQIALGGKIGAGVTGSNRFRELAGAWKTKLSP